MASLVDDSSSDAQTVVTPSTSPRPTKARDKFKYLTALETINHDCVYNLKPKILTSDTSPIAASEKWFALPYEGGGGPVYVAKVDSKGKVEPTRPSTVNGHKGPVYGVAFSPFCGGDVFASAADDCKVCVWDLSKESEQQQTLLEGSHSHGAREVCFHPLVRNALVSTAADGDSILWDLEKSAIAKQWKLTTASTGTSCLDWTYDGSLLLASCRDKTLRAVDLREDSRTCAFTAEPHAGSAKSFRAKFASVGGLGYVLSAGNPARKGGREVSVIDLRQPTKVLQTKTIDSQNGAMMPHFDEVTGILWLWGRGDTTVRHLEVRSSGELLDLTAGHEFRASGAGPHVGYAALPSRCMDARGLQVAKFLRLTSTTVEGVSFAVPRTPELKTFFNDDVYAAEARTGEPSLESCEAWLAGTDAGPPLTETMRPDGMPLLSEKPVEVQVLNTQLVNEKIKVETQQKNDDHATYARLTKLANTYEKYQPNGSMGGRKGVDAAVIDGGEVDDDEWDD